jgi:hypothetical protein
MAASTPAVIDDADSSYIDMSFLNLLLECCEYLVAPGEHESFISPILFVCRALSGFLLCDHALHEQYATESDRSSQ